MIDSLSFILYFGNVVEMGQDGLVGDVPCRWRKMQTRSPSDTGCSSWGWHPSRWPSSAPPAGQVGYLGHFHCRKSPGLHPPWVAAGKPSPGHICTKDSHYKLPRCMANWTGFSTVCNQTEELVFRVIFPAAPFTPMHETIHSPKSPSGAVYATSISVTGWLAPEGPIPHH